MKNSTDCSSPCLMDWLPSEVLTRILAMLDQTSRARCAQLSRRWYNLAMQPRLWRRLVIYGKPSVITAELLGRISSWMSGSLLELDFRVRSGCVAALLSESLSLQSLTIYKPMICEDAENPLTALGRCCPQLRSLRLLECGSTQVLTANSVAQLLAGCPKLSHLEISLNSERSLTLLGSLAARLVSLNLHGSFPFGDLDLPRCPELTSLTVWRLLESGLEPVLPRLPCLSGLTLHDSDFIDGLAKALAVSCPGLRSVRQASPWFGLRDLTADGLVALLKGCPQLSCLEVPYCKPLDSAGYRRVVGSLRPDFQQLRLLCGSLTEADLQTRLPAKLTRLQLDFNNNCGGIEGLRTGLSGCSELTHLVLTDCNDELLSALLIQLPRLRNLRLSSCSRLTRQAWAKLRELSAFPHDLREFVVLFSICSGSSLTDESVADICASPIARGLRWLCLDNCKQLTSQSLTSIVSSCPWLTRLALLSCYAIAEPHQLAFRAAFQHRVELELRGAPEWALDLCDSDAES